MPHPTDTGARTRVAPTASTGATAKDFGPSSAAQSIVYIAGLLFRNAGSVTHTVQILSSGGGVILEFDLPATPSGFILDGRSGRWESDIGESLQFKFTDGAGAAGDVKVSGAVVQRGSSS